MSIDIMIVDDSAGSRFLVERSLRLAQVDIGSCHHAESGAIALHLLEDHPVQLILTDLHMDEMDGCEFIRRVRAREQMREIPIAVVTSEQSAATREEVAGLGADFFLMKPLTAQTITGLFHQIQGRMRA